MLPTGCRSVRLAAAQPAAALNARRQRASGLGHGDRCLGCVADANHGAHLPLLQWACRRFLCDFRHWYGHLHHPIMTQVAAELLGLPLENISIKLGDSTLPQSPVEGGSWIAASVTNAIAEVCAEVRSELLRLAKSAPGSPLADAVPGDVVLVDGKIASKRDINRAMTIADAMRRGAVERIERERTYNPQPDEKHSHNTHQAVFAEVMVDEQLGVIRVTRIVNAVAAGRIINTKTAHSQIMGAAVWGIGMALHEETLIDHTLGRIMNADIAGYHVPVNADVHDIQVIFVDEPDDIINPLGIKGLGEPGIWGVAAVTPKGVYHATGKRVRDRPIPLDKLGR